MFRIFVDYSDVTPPEQNPGSWLQITDVMKKKNLYG